MWSSNLGRSRTKFGKWAEKNDLSQQDLKRMTGISHATISDICGDPEYKGTTLTKRRIIFGLQKHGYDVEFSDFW